MITTVLAACSNSDLEAQLPDNRPNYKQSRVSNPLEVPPDLTQSSVDDVLAIPELSGTANADLSTYQQERGQAAMNSRSLSNSLQNIHRRGDVSWIEIADSPDKVFKNAKSFWLNNGLSLSRVDANIGIMETDWLEARGDMPQGGISRLIGQLISGLEDNGLRDKFRTRIDYDGEKTYVYLTHYGATEEEVDIAGRTVKSSGNKKDTKFFAWKASSRNPELEVEMLRRLNLYLNQRGQQNAVAKAEGQGSGGISTTTLTDGTPALVIDSDFNQAWIMLGIAIDRAGYELNSQDRKNGTYSFAKVTEKEVGLFIKEVERTVETYSIGLADQGTKQIAVMRSYNRQAISSDAAKAVLEKISQEISL